MNKRFIFSLLALIFSFSINAQNNDAYNIKVKINKTTSKEIYLGFHYDNNKYVKDTAKVNSKGEFVFSGKEKLETGLYLIVLENMQMFEILIDDNQHFSIETDTLDLAKNAKFKNHPLNTAFYNFILDNAKNSQTLMSYKSRLSELDPKSDSAKFYQSEIEKINNNVTKAQDDIIAKFPNSLLANMFLATKDVPNPLPLNTKDDTLNYFHYNLNHYWDNFKWSDGGLARTPILYNKLNTFFEKMVYKVPDSLIKYSDIVLEKSKAHKENYKYTVQFLYKTFANSKMVCHENVIHHIAKNYYTKDKAWWADTATLNRIEKTVADMEGTLCGQTVHNLSLPDTSGIKFHQLYKKNADYTVLIFWDPNCGHCQKEIPRLQHILDSALTKMGVDVYGVCTQRNLEELRKFVKEKEIKFLNTLVTEDMAKYPERYIYTDKVTDIKSMNLHKTFNIKSTPLIFVLDKDKKILASKLNVEDLAPFLKAYERQQKAIKELQKK